MFPRIESIVKGCKDHINWLEMNRVSALLRTLKSDEGRLAKCIDDIEDFHRDMFLLPNKDEPVSTENTTALEDYMIRSEYLSDPESSVNTDSQSSVNNSGMNPMNELYFPMNVADLSMLRPECSMNVQNSRGSLILKIFNSTSDNSCTSSLSQETSGEGKNESDAAKDESDAAKDESDAAKDESDAGRDEPSDDRDEPSDDRDEPSDDRDEPSDDRDEPSDEIENEKSKKVILELLAYEEKEVTELILHLIQAFSSFQCKLRAAEATASQPLKFFPDKPKVNIRKTLKALTGSVLHLDKTVGKIYAKYSYMLQCLGEIFQ